MKVRLTGLLAVAVALLLWVSPVLAFDDPSSVSIGGAYVFEDVLEAGDQLFFVVYDVAYDPVPNVTADNAWQVSLYEEGGDLVATRALNYYNLNIISLYLDSAGAVSDNDPHKIKVMGMPSVFGNLTEGVNMVTHTYSSGEYKPGDELGAVMITIAGTLETDWGMDLLSTTQKLNDTGSAYFTLAVPGLGSMDPTIFQTTVRELDVPEPNWNMAYAEQLEARSGSRFREAINGTMGGIFGITEEFWQVAWIAGIAFLLIGAPVYAATRQPVWAMAAGFPVVAGIGWLGVGTSDYLYGIGIVVFVLGVSFAILFVLRHFG